MYNVVSASIIKIKKMVSSRYCDNNIFWNLETIKWDHTYLIQDTFWLELHTAQIADPVLK